MANVLIKTPCASAALKYFGVEGTTWNQRTGRNVWPDTLRRAGYSVRSRMSKMPKGATVGKCRAKLAQIAQDEPGIKGFVVRVQSHVLVLDRTGRTVVDTAPRKRDARRVKGVMAIM